MLFYPILFLCSGVLVAANNSPVLIWSPSRSLKDLPQSYAGHTVSTEKFSDEYLAPLTADNNHNTVVFLQDKLSLEDFTHHADVYNPSSEGGAFKNIKSAMDDQFSVHLSAVKQPQEAIDSIVSSFPGEVHRVDNSDQLDSLELKEGKKHLILVTLPATRGKDEAKAFAKNDAMMGRCMHHMNKRGIRYTALYTAGSVDKTAEEAVHHSRRLLAEAPQQGNGTFQNKTYALLYLTGVNLTVENSPTKRDSIFLPADDDSVTVTESYVDNELEIDMTIKDANVSLQIVMQTNGSIYAGEWVVKSGKAVVKGISSTWTDYDTEVDMVFDSITAPYGFGYHCSSLNVIMAKAKNASAAKNTTKVFIAIQGFQYEPYYNHSGAHFGNDVWDCVPFFTVPIWMGIISTTVLMIILFFGLTMITSIKTMDRFDDPKGKTITVNVAD